MIAGVVMITNQLSLVIAGTTDPDESSGVGNWVNIEQQVIPEEQRIATIEDLKLGLAQLESGQSAHTAFSPKCPIKIGGAPGNKTVYYTVTFYVHHSEHVDPEIEVTLNNEVLDITGPRPGFLPKSKSWIVQKNKTQELGWRVQEGLFSYNWEIAFDEQANKLFQGSSLLPVVTHDDGIAYFIGDPVTGSVRISGTAAVDIYTCKIGQRVGTKWQGGLYATAWWPPGEIRENQHHVTEELFLPECAIEKIEACLGAIEALLENGIDPFAAAVDGYSPISNLNPTVYLDVDDCSGEVFGKTPNT